MNFAKTFVIILELLGTVAFAFSGAIVAIRRRMDIFGVLVLGSTAATGGGIIRDIVLGITPPTMFINPVYFVTAAVTSLMIFVLVYYKSNVWDSRYMLFSVRIINAMDSVGLGVFTVVGINTAVASGFGEREFLMIFVGTVTGVGGGILRDLLAGYMPTVLHKRIYASASIVGGLCYIFVRTFIVDFAAMLIGAAVIILIRYLASKYRWHLPRATTVPDSSSDET
jgi:uncharacterized membrane protein YeiH